MITSPRAKTQAALFICSWLAAVQTPSVYCEDIKLGTNTVVQFANVETGRQILTRRDDFVSALSPFDRAARMKTDQAVSEDQYLKFVGRNVMAWSPEETNRVTAIFQDLTGKLNVWHLPFPPTIYLIKTSGKEEGHASYTRQNAVVICERDLQQGEPGLTHLVTHELFHILSRNNPKLRKKLYEIIGFNSMNAMDYPVELQDRKITNPDGVQCNWFITVTNQGRTLPVIPILYASTPNYVPSRGGEFFDYLTFKLLAVTNNGARWGPERLNGQLQMLDPIAARGFFDQIGDNTRYIIHPDEILADNFVRFINGQTNVPTPRIITGMKRALLEQNPDAR